jgi:hypothetical protein
MKPTKHCEIVEERERKNGNIMEGVNLSKVHGTSVWNSHNEIHLYY